MTHIIRTAGLLVAILGTFLFAVGGDVDSPSPDARSKAVGIADPALRLYWPTDKLCGPIAVQVALLDHGVVSDFESVARSLPPSRRGTSMDECAEYLRSKGVQCACIQATASSLENLLQNHKYVGAILLIDGNHWVYSRRTVDGAIRFYDYPTWLPASDNHLFTRFNGPAILVGRPDDIASIYRDWLIVCGTVILTSIAAVYIGLAVYGSVRKSK